jgi:hypothetical protein
VTVNNGSHHGVHWADGAVGLVVGVTVATGSVEQPFTISADVTVSVALMTMVIVVIDQRKAVPRIARLSRAASRNGLDHRTGGWAISPWAAVVSAAVSWEMFSLLSTPRISHPTLSSLLSSLDASVPGRALAIFAWMVLGGYLVTR